MNYTVEEWEGGTMVRVLAGSPNLDVAHAAYEAATKLIDAAARRGVTSWIEFKNGTRLVRRYPKEAGAEAATAGE
jgi:hypothetical protein